MRDIWNYTFDLSPVLVLEERRDRGRRIYARWWRGRSGARGYWAKRRIGGCIRDEATGRVLPDLERQVLRVGAELHAALHSGGDPRTVIIGGQGHLTLHDGLARYTAVGVGAYAADTRHRRAQLRLVTRLEDILGPRTPWVVLGAEAATRVWRALAEQSRGGTGRRVAEQMVALLGAAASWLRSRELVSPGAGPVLPPRWRRRLRMEWGQVTGVMPGEPERPRYTEAEVRAILWQAEAPSTDPRLRLALIALAGPELRLGQVIAHARRSDLDLSLGAGLGFGTLRIRGQSTKRGVVVAFDAYARGALDDALAGGHLADLERAYRQSGMDYALSPAGRPTRGRWPAGRSPLRSMALSTLRVAYQALEHAAGVDHRPGRGWHALRRSAADAALALATEEPPTDPRILARLGGWADTSHIRQDIYLDRESQDLARSTHVLRSRLRARLRGAGGVEPVRPPHASADSSRR